MGEGTYCEAREPARHGLSGILSSAVGEKHRCTAHFDERARRGRGHPEAAHT